MKKELKLKSGKTITISTEINKITVVMLDAITRLESGRHDIVDGTIKIEPLAVDGRFDADGLTYSKAPAGYSFRQIWLQCRSEEDAAAIKAVVADAIETADSTKTDTEIDLDTIPGYKEIKACSYAWEVYNDAVRRNINSDYFRKAPAAPAQKCEDLSAKHPYAQVAINAETLSLKSNHNMAGIGFEAIKMLKAGADYNDVKQYMDDHLEEERNWNAWN